MFNSDFTRIEIIVRALLRGLHSNAVCQILYDVEQIGLGPEAAECDSYLAENLVYCHNVAHRQTYVLMMASLGGPQCTAAVEHVMRNDPWASVRLAAVYAACAVGPDRYLGSLVWAAARDAVDGVRVAAENVLAEVLDNEVMQ